MHNLSVVCVRMCVCVCVCVCGVVCIYGYKRRSAGREIRQIEKKQLTPNTVGREKGTRRGQGRGEGRGERGPRGEEEGGCGQVNLIFFEIFELFH